MKLLQIMRFFAVLLFVGMFCGSAKAQSLIINEVSQGPSGSKEYVEFLVIPGAGPYHCTDYCVDLRNWIIDDNSGYFSGGQTSGTGVAAGAVRFSNDAIWSCVPIGTLIVVYNDADINVALPGQDISTSDGNCRIVLPVSSILLEFQTTSPGASSTTYPTSGWVAGGSPWGPLGMSNSDDSFQVYSSTNSSVPVSGVSWGNNTTNNIIYFSGSASNEVFYFNNTVSNDPSLQANWTAGTCAGPDDQTPGTPNNTANAAYINSLTNSCAGPLVLNESHTGACSCDGTATANATGSIPPYTYNWLNASNSPINQTAATATGLCAGNYACIVTSSIGCVDTVLVTIGTQTGQTTPTFDVIGPLCQNAADVQLPTTSSNGYAGTWNTPYANAVNVGTTTYTFTPTSNCATTTTLDVVVLPNVTPTFNPWGPYCQGDVLAQVILPDTSLEGISGSWSPQMVSTATIGSIFHTFTPDANQCANGTTMEIVVNASTSPTFSGFSDLCVGENAPALPTNSLEGIPGTWTPATISSTTAGSTTYTFQPSTGFCASQYNLTINVNDLDIPSLSNQTICSGEAVTLTATGTSNYQWNNGIQNGVAFFPTATTTYTLTTSSGSCSATSQVTITVNNTPTSSFTPSTTNGLTPLNVSFTNTSSAATNFGWNFGNGQTTTSFVLDTQNAQYTEPGSYTVTLIAANGNCADTSSIVISVLSGDTIIIEVPNVFTPNGDNVNDTLFVNTVNAKTFHAIIVNRWGDFMYEITTPNGSWNGMSKNQECTEGVYFLLYDATDYNDKKYNGQTFFHLIR